ncbi:helix-turn-helix transcriptional regulator [Streptomyces sp. VNUA24]|uniref:helix-turn-helix domain-containing protein n=1 Tax=Streptomyces sp. VNUA24 TaxID=3031131 RepID=UPI0023B7CBC3|nr:helix-turn-helix transcriptional regulator [Streptomyces sp. VNUA24]WEH12228.1 helix-turn-helix transcriptional regulator [Streptomyces sp. VNUA24]
MYEPIPTNALLPAAAPRDLPAPDERRRLRRQSDLSLHQAADACSVTETTVRDWENGTTTPRGHNADVYRNLLAGLHARLTQTPAPAYADTTAPDWPALGAIHREIPSQAGTDQPCRRCRQPTGQRVGGKPQHLGTRCPAPAPHPASPPTASVPAQPAPTQPAAVFPPAIPAARLDYPTAGRRTSAGPLAVIDTDGGQTLAAHYPDGHRRPLAADNCTELLSWAVTAGLGTPAVKPGAGLDTGPLLVLTEAATARLALPLTPPAWAQRHPRSDHPLLRQLRAIGWQTDTHGLGPWSTLHPSNQDPHRDGIHLAVTAWGALYRDAWKLPETLDAAQLASLLGQYTSLLRTPLGTPGDCGHRLMSDLRPPARRHPASGALPCPGAPGALTECVEPAPCEAPAGHHLAAGRAAADSLAVEDLNWWRTPAPAEAECAYVVCLAVNLPYVADCNNIRVADGPACEVDEPPFDRKTPGSWLVALPPVRPQHPQLPSPFPTEGLAWHPTPAVAYALERGVTIRPVKGWLRRASPPGPYLNPWYDRFRKAHLTALERLGITAQMTPQAFETALHDLPHGDPAGVSLLRAVHASADGGLARLAAQPVGPDHHPALPWTSPPDPSWRPDLLAAVTANTRANVHRKLCQTARTGHFPLAVHAGHILYATRTPSILEITGEADCGFRVGISPGHVRPVAVRTMDWFLEHCRQDHNPAQALTDTAVPW